VRFIPSKKASDAEMLPSLDPASERMGEFFVIAVGAVAMLLVVGIFDMVGLLP